MFFDNLEFVEDSVSNLDRLSDLYTQTFKYLLDLDKNPLSYKVFCEKLISI